MASKGSTLELAVLGLLHESPLHGYELRKRLNLLLGWSRVLSYGSLYPALKRMLRAGWVTEVTTMSPGVSRRQRIVYQIAPAGSEHFATAMNDSGPASWEDENFTMRFALFSRTDAGVRMRILEGRRSRLQERIDRARAASDRGHDRYVTELQRHTLESMEREVRWLSELIDAEHGEAHRRTTAPATPAKKPGRKPGPTSQPKAQNSSSPATAARSQAH
jgi:DNA-binding PadR family transcriptional regulator